MLPARSIAYWRQVLTATPLRWRVGLRLFIAGNRRHARRIGSDVMVPRQRRSVGRARIFVAAGEGLAVLLAAGLLFGGTCFASDAPPPPKPDATSPDGVTETLLRTIVQQISGGRIISPPEDNAMQTWQRVLQRDIALQRSPEVIKALEAFDTYARARAADEKAAGRALVAAELIVFADQASRMVGRAPPAESPGAVAPSPDTATNVAPADRSGHATVAPSGATHGQTVPPAGIIGGKPAGPTAGAKTSAEAGMGGATPPSAATATSASARTPAVNGNASVTDGLMHVASHTQPSGAPAVAADAAGSDGRSVRPVGSTEAATNATASAASRLVAADTATASPSPASGVAPHAAPGHAVPSATVVASGAAPQVPSNGVSTSADAGKPPGPISSDSPASSQGMAGGTAPITPTVSGDATQMPDASHDGVPFDRLAAHLAAQAIGAEVPGLRGSAASTAQTVADAGGAATGAVQHDGATANQTPPAVTSAAAQPAVPDTAMAAFYAARGDAMLANKDISAARKFYEFAANAGSARAATALARTYDPAFAAQLDEVGLRPDPKLAAFWYRKAQELGGGPAQLSQSDNTGK